MIGNIPALFARVRAIRSTRKVLRQTPIGSTATPTAKPRSPLDQADQPSTYDLTVRAKDRLPLDITLAVDNTGTSDTGLYRVGLGLDWTNAFWRGDDLSYGFLTSPDSSGCWSMF